MGEVGAAAAVAAQAAASDKGIAAHDCHHGDKTGEPSHDKYHPGRDKQWSEGSADEGPGPLQQQLEQ